MKVKVVPSYRNTKEFTVEIQQGSQFFRLDYSGKKSECQWMAKMFRKALAKHDAELGQTQPVKRRSKKIKPTTPEDIDRQFAPIHEALNKAV